MRPLLFSFYRFPTDPTPGTPEPLPPDPDRTPWLPVKDDDVSFTGDKVAKSWALRPQLTLIWITPAQFAAKVLAFTTLLNSRQSAGGNRPAQTAVLASLDKQAEEGISSLKTDIKQKFKKANVDQYPRYGIEKRGKNYELPLDRNQRYSALKLTLAAVTADGIGSAPYDKVFWTKMLADYKKAMDDTSATDSSVSDLVKQKNTAREEILEAMASLQFVVRGNYPKTYEAEFRAMGWQKEDY